uniref:G2 and S phase-expressed protein 1 N-terminal domain-containing protein n=1 Tax=Eptatretus burgeri TaxID=7764 RepID=A0A8C4QV68_EPTBU
MELLREGKMMTALSDLTNSLNLPEVSCIADEKFDFDFALSPESHSGTDEEETNDDDEVFFGPVGHRERTAMANRGLLPCGGEQETQGECGTLTHLSGTPGTRLPQNEISEHGMARICKEARQLAVKLKSESTSPQQPDASLSVVPVVEKFATDWSCKLKMLKTESPAGVSSPRRETFLVGPGMLLPHSCGNASVMDIPQVQGLGVNLACGEPEGTESADVSNTAAGGQKRVGSDNRCSAQESNGDDQEKSESKEACEEKLLPASSLHPPQETRVYKYANVSGIPRLGKSKVSLRKPSELQQPVPSCRFGNSSSGSSSSSSSSFDSAQHPSPFAKLQKGCAPQIPQLKSSTSRLACSSFRMSRVSKVSAVHLGVPLGSVGSTKGIGNKAVGKEPRSSSLVTPSKLRGRQVAPNSASGSLERQTFRPRCFSAHGNKSLQYVSTMPVKPPGQPSNVLVGNPAKSTCTPIKSARRTSTPIGPQHALSKPACQLRTPVTIPKSRSSLGISQRAEQVNLSPVAGVRQPSAAATSPASLLGKVVLPAVGNAQHLPIPMRSLVNVVSPIIGEAKGLSYLATPPLTLEVPQTMLELKPACQLEPLVMLGLEGSPKVEEGQLRGVQCGENKPLDDNSASPHPGISKELIDLTSPLIDLSLPLIDLAADPVVSHDDSKLIEL